MATAGDGRKGTGCRVLEDVEIVVEVVVLEVEPDGVLPGVEVAVVDF